MKAGSRMAEAARRGVATAVAAAAFLLAVNPPGAAAQDAPLSVAEGVELGLLYGAAPLRTVVVRSFSASQGPDAGLEVEAGRAEAIVVRDLEISDRFAVLRASDLPSIPSADYAAWDALGADFVVNATIEAHPEGSRLRLGVYDVVYGVPLREAAFPLPPSSAPTFRMAVHRISDEVVAWITGEPGMAASRIVYGRGREDGGYDVVIVDSDGEDVRRVARHEGLAFSPVWSPEGVSIAYTAMTDAAMYEVIGLTLADGTPRALAPPRELVMTPAWSSDGSRLAVAISEGRREDLYELDPRSGRLRLMERAAMEPSYAPDGRRLAFSSDRLGTSQVWIAALQDGDPELISPWAVRDRNSYHGPDWSPDGSMVAFHSGNLLHFQILFADPTGTRGPRQITWEGRSESPSWAPDSRHLVVHGHRNGREGLYVLDAVTGRTRLLVEGSDVRTPDWSPALSGGSGGPPGPF